MAWSSIRKATDADRDALQAAAVRFCHRHSIAFETDADAITEIDCLTAIRDSSCGYELQAKAARLRPLWARIVRRTLNAADAEGIAYGHVGFNVQ